MPRRYSKEFGEGAVELARRGDRPIREIAKELWDRWLWRWAKQSQLDRRERDDGLSSAECEELVELRRRVRRLEQEKDILRKAAAFFAREETR